MSSLREHTAFRQHTCCLALALLIAISSTAVVGASQSLGPCGAGTVGSTAGGPFDVLTVDGSAGGADRRIDLFTVAPFMLDIAAPPGLASANFALFLTTGAPGPGEVTPLPFGIGDMCFAPTVVLLPSGVAPFSLLAPGLGDAVDAAIQALIIDPAQPLSIGITNGVILSFSPCGTTGPTFVALHASGGSATSGHYALAFCATINDPHPKLIGPGHLFTASEWAKIRLAPITSPGTATDDYVWSGGDEVGYFRGRMAVDGSSPGIDRIFFVARNTSNTPNFIDWDGTAFANETSLTAASGGIQRLWVMPDGDLCGNDFFGNTYRWDKQNGYAQTLLFQFTNGPGSVPWGTSLDLALGQPAFDPVSSLILFPIDNDGVSLSGQLYGFDLAGNRVFVDQDLMGTPLNGAGSHDFGVTVDLANPTCRVLVHGGKNSGSFFVARFSNGLQQKVVAQVGGSDSQGGWQGVLIGSQLWTNTNNFSYGLVERDLPTDW